MMTWAIVVVIILALLSNFWIWLILAVLAIIFWLFYRELF